MTLIEKINEVLKKYLIKYPEIDIPRMKFSEDTEGNIYFNNCFICSDKDLEFQFSSIEIDCITLYFNKNRQITIELIWEEDTLPKIKSFGYSYN